MHIVSILVRKHVLAVRTHMLTHRRPTALVSFSRGIFHRKRVLSSVFEEHGTYYGSNGRNPGKDSATK